MGLVAAVGAVSFARGGVPGRRRVRGARRVVVWSARVAPHPPQRRAVGEGELALGDVAVALVEGAVSGRGRLVVGGHVLAVGAVEHVAQEAPSRCRGLARRGASPGTGSSTAAASGGTARRSRPAGRSARRQVRRAASSAWPNDSSSSAREQLRAGWQPHRGAVAVSGEVRLAEADVGCDVQLEHRLDELPATVLVGQQPPSSPGRRRTRRRRWRRRRRVADVGAADAEVGGRCEGHGCAPVSGSFGSTMTDAAPAGASAELVYPLRRTRPCCTANSAAAARVDTPILV